MARRARKEKKQKIVGLVIALILSCLSLLGICQISQDVSVNGELMIHFIDVGQADAAVILCDGQVMMIDGGNAEDSSLIYSYLRNTLGISHIDYMIATHPHEDHIGGLSGALNACSVGKLYSPVDEYDSKVFNNLVKYAGKQGLTLTEPVMGERFSLGEASVQFISPVKRYEEVNDLSIAVRISYGNTTFLFTGDAEWEAEHDMVNSGYRLDATLLKVGHHGSSSSTNYLFLREVMPKYAVISVGKDNSYGHPTEETLSRLRDAGSEIYRTDELGSIVVRSDGQQLTFYTGDSWKFIPEKTDTPESAVPKATLSVTAKPESAVRAAPPQPNGSMASYTGDNSRGVFHYTGCSEAVLLNADVKVNLPSRTVAISYGYTPCDKCRP